MKKIKLLLCDDHGLMRKGLASIMGSQNWIEVVGTVDSGEAAINFVAGTETDIVLMDIVMNGMSGLEATRWIKEQSPAVKVILVSGEVTPSSITSGIKVGADGYVLKHSSDDKLFEAIRTVSKGEIFFGLEVVSLVAEEASKNALKGNDGKSNADTNSQFLRLLISGCTMEQIESKLSIPKKSGRELQRNIMTQLGLKISADVIQYAISHSIVKI